MAPVLKTAACQSPGGKRDPGSGLTRSYRLDYPADFVPQGESDSSDGQVFVGEEGAELRVWGGFFKQRPPAPCKRSCSAAEKADAGLPLKLPVRIFSGSPATS